MPWVTSGVAFVATVLIVGTMVYALSPGGSIVPERLSRLWHRSAGKTEYRWSKGKSLVKAQKVLSGIGRLVPSSPQDLSSSQRMMARAGYRRPQAVLILRGFKVLLPAGLLCLVYVTGLYRQNPVLILGFAGVGGFLLPDLVLTWQIMRRQHVLRLALPDALDLLVVCVEAGLGLDQSLLRVSQELRIAHPQLCEELDLVNAEIRVGKRRIDALRALGDRTGVDDIKSLAAMLIQTDRFGTSVAQSLRVYSDELRTKRRQRAEEMAAKTTVKMIPPLVFLIFPALFVVILGPAIITIARDFLHK
jgi:tight adherence protein C